MQPTVQLSSRAEILSFFRRASEFADNEPDDDYSLLLQSGIVPKAWLTDYLRRKHIEYPAAHIEYLIAHRKLIETTNYFKSNPRDRERPIATQYKREKPRVSRLVRKRTSYNVFGRDRLALWYAAANQELKGSQGEARGLWLILQFWRLPNIQRAWRRWRLANDKPSFKLPEDAR